MWLNIAVRDNLRLRVADVLSVPELERVLDVKQLCVSVRVYVRICVRNPDAVNKPQCLCVQHQHDVILDVRLVDWHSVPLRVGLGLRKRVSIELRDAVSLCVCEWGSFAVTAHDLVSQQLWLQLHVRDAYRVPLV